jgi:hypothetical protein
MFILIYFVFFDFKKSNQYVYSSTWVLDYSKTIQLKFKKTVTSSYDNLYQQTLLTSRTIIILLFMVFNVYMFLGDYLVTIIFNYSQISTNVMSVFFNIKHKQVLLTQTFSGTTLTSLTFIIISSIMLTYSYILRLS